MQDGASFETERGRDDQPDREDLLDAERIDDEDAVPRDDRDEGPAGRLPSPDELPESQGADVLDAERLTEDAAARPPLSDEDR